MQFLSLYSPLIGRESVAVKPVRRVFLYATDLVADRCINFLAPLVINFVVPPNNGIPCDICLVPSTRNEMHFVSDPSLQLSCQFPGAKKNGLVEIKVASRVHYYYYVLLVASLAQAFTEWAIESTTFGEDFLKVVALLLQGFQSRGQLLHISDHLMYTKEPTGVGYHKLGTGS